MSVEQPAPDIRARTSMSEQAEFAPDKIVVLIHGIRTDGWWQSIGRAVFERDANTVVATIKYGYLDLFRFWCPFLFRSGPIRRIREELVGISDKYPGVPIFVIAHSFGTYAISKILLDNPTIKIHRLILCGSIVPEDFPWERVETQILFPTKDNKVVNDCGSLDIWPRMAQAFTWGYGPSGIVGFGSYLVRDRFHRTSHSGFFTEEFIEKYWLPVFAAGTVVPTTFEKSGPTTSLLYRALGFINKYSLAALIAAFALYLYQDPIGATYLQSLLPIPHSCPYLSGTWKTFPSAQGQPLTLNVSHTSACQGNIELYQGDRIIGQSLFSYDPNEKSPRTIVNNRVPFSMGRSNRLLQCNLGLTFATQTALVIQFMNQTWAIGTECPERTGNPVTFVKIDNNLHRERHWIPLE